MKKLITLLLLIFPFCLSAQNTSGEIIFKQTFIMNFEGRDMPEHVKQMLKDMPKERSSKKQLFFNKNESLFQAYDDPNEEIETRGGGMRMMMRMGDNGITYINTEKNLMAQQREMFGRTFLIQDTLGNLSWKMTGENKEIAGYACMGARAMRDSQEVVAWFTPMIQAFNGPGGVSGLPGMILELSMRNGDLTITAEKVTMRALNDGEITEPTKGKKVTKEEFREIMKEKREEMKEMNGGHGEGHMIIHSR